MKTFFFLSFLSASLVGHGEAKIRSSDAVTEEEQAFWTRALQEVADSFLVPTQAPMTPTYAPTAEVDPPIISNATIFMDRVYFTVSTYSLDNSTAFSETSLFVPIWDGDIDSAPNDIVCFIGEGFELDKNVTSFLWGGPDCQVANGCGVHVHEGFDCANDDTQAGHWYNKDVLTIDPWLTTGYLSTDEDGYAQFAGCVRTGFDLVSDPNLLLGRAFILHNADGTRASCGVIEPTTSDFSPLTLIADTSPIPGTTENVNGYVEVLEELHANVFDAICYQGYATGLEKNVESFLLGTGSTQCDVSNGCGAHIHAGTGCENVDIQLGHLYDPDQIPVDPWLLESYYRTDDAGSAAFVGCIITGEEDFFQRAFIVHGTDGSRLSCGTLN
ncbi:copper/zinc superoxide dismutase SODC [Nitzschia inconspicua]|uniref:Copper/zinc superoxide dismutase SODC n=1 Tax=Nitzschia inconspicua TaxID=303405 RepID=A0A9K3M5L8_9STRA|nr:copper/zinc superoxide dismutase SODC [Nitzschia inconspicua]